MSKSWSLKSVLATVLICMALATAAPCLAQPPKPIRLAAVFAPSFSGLLSELIADFKSQGGADVEVVAGIDIYGRGRAGEADLIISHYGFSEVEAFVKDGYGRWPRTVFSNQMVIVGPKNDPARIRGLTSATDAFRRIAEAKAPFVANALPAVIQLTDFLWESAGRPDKAQWYIDDGTSKGQAVKLAEEKAAYVIWGAPPFLQFVEKHGSEMEILVAADPILQRVMCTVVVDPRKVPGVNAAGAEVFEHYLLSARAQARVAAFRAPGRADLQLWWPAALHNDTAGAP